MPMISLAVLLTMTGWGEGARFGADFFGQPAVVLHGRGDPENLKTIALAGARNEHLFLPILLEGNSPPLETQAEGLPHGVICAFFRALAVPLASHGVIPPDAMIPLGDELSGSPDAPVILWVSLKIAPDCPPGRHLFHVVIKDRRQRRRLPVQLRVYRFSLPDDLPIALFAGFWPRQGPWFREASGRGDAESDLIKSYYRSLRAYKFNVLGGSQPLPLGRLRPGDRLEDFSEYQELLRYALNDLGFTSFQIPRLKGWESVGAPDGAFTRQAHIFYPLYAEYLRRHGWETRALNYLVDEPRPAQREAVVQAFALAKSLAPGIRTLSAGWDAPPQFARVIDIWAHQAAHYREAEHEKARSRGQEAWLYANRLHSIGNPLAQPRLIGWLLYRYRFSGYLFWGVNFWPENPWTTPPGPRDFYRRGTFYYPHPQTGLPLPSLRLEALRRGFQDYQYLQLLDRAVQRGVLPPEKQAVILAQVRGLTDNLPHNAFPASMAELEAVRLQIGEMLDGAPAPE
jgi:hypothetical protein